MLFPHLSNLFKKFYIRDFFFYIVNQYSRHPNRSVLHSKDELVALESIIPIPLGLQQAPHPNTGCW